MHPVAMHQAAMHQVAMHQVAIHQAANASSICMLEACAGVESTRCSLVYLRQKMHRLLHDHDASAYICFQIGKLRGACWHTGSS